MKLELRQFPDDVLTARAEPIEEFDDNLRQLAHAMLDLMYDSKGVGLAAPQVGVSRRLIVMDPVAGDPDDLFGRAAFLVNPQIVERSEEMVLGPEGCLSIPGVTVEVPRHRSITVEYQTLTGEQKRIVADDPPACIVQHEVEHLDGIVMLDHAWRNKR